MFLWETEQSWLTKRKVEKVIFWIITQVLSFTWAKTSLPQMGRSRGYKYIIPILWYTMIMLLKELNKPSVNCSVRSMMQWQMIMSG